MEILFYIFIFFIIILLFRSLQNEYIIKEKKTKEKWQNYEERLKKTEKKLKKSKYKEEDNDEFEDEDYLNKKNKYK
jgi:sortase (surface protein transpeptidase)